MSVQYSGFLEKLWSRSGGGFGFTATLDRNTNTWTDHDHPWDNLGELEQPDMTDLFFSPLTYEKPRRLVTLHMPASLLFADLDPVNPEGLDIPPHLWWETSTGSYQAIWYLNAPIPYRTQWADLNRRMTYHTGADKGGWSGSKVLRIPGTYNYKRNEAGGPLMEAQFRPYTAAELDHKLMPTAMIVDAPEIGEAPPIETDRSALDSMWRSLSARMQWELNNKRVQDRSAHIVRTAYLLKEEGVPLETAYHMLWYAPFNKWRFRNNSQRLWIELSTVYERG